MNSQFNYATFIDLFLESDEEFEPYGVSQSDSVQPANLEPVEPGTRSPLT